MKISIGDKVIVKGYHEHWDGTIGVVVSFVGSSVHIIVPNSLSYNGTNLLGFPLSNLELCGLKPIKHMKKHKLYEI